MTDLIDRAALRKVLGQHKREAALFGDEAKWEEMREAIAILDAAPTISCAECEYWEKPAEESWNYDEARQEYAGKCLYESEVEGWSIEGEVEPKTVPLLAYWGSSNEYSFEPGARFGCVCFKRRQP